MKYDRRVYVHARTKMKCFDLFRARQREKETNFSGFFSIDHRNHKEECEMRETKSKHETLMTPFSSVRCV